MGSLNIICSSCDASNPVGTLFCLGCGIELPPTPDDEPGVSERATKLGSSQQEQRSTLTATPGSQAYVSQTSARIDREGTQKPPNISEPPPRGEQRAPSINWTAITIAMLAILFGYFVYSVSWQHGPPSRDFPQGVQSNVEQHRGLDTTPRVTAIDNSRMTLTGLGDGIQWSCLLPRREDAGERV